MVDNIHIAKVNLTALRMHIIAASQDAVFLPSESSCSYRRNLDPWNIGSADEVLASLNTVGLHETIQARGGVNAIAEPSGLSGGEKQLFCLARLVLRRRVRARQLSQLGFDEGGLLLLDEITSSVDKKVEETMIRVILTEFRRYTVVIVTHSMEVAARCDRLIILRNGRIVDDGDAERLKRKLESFASGCV